MKNRYLYVELEGETYALWYTHPKRSVPMLNREQVSIQRDTPTRRVVGENEPLDDERKPALNSHGGSGATSEPAQMTLDVEEPR